MACEETMKLEKKASDSPRHSPRLFVADSGIGSAGNLATNQKKIGFNHS
jgi:hypothetical protein